jgi:hypothetical protein
MALKVVDDAKRQSTRRKATFLNEEKVAARASAVSEKLGW